MLDYVERHTIGCMKSYDYFVEGDRSMSGEVLLDQSSGVCKVVELAPNDSFSRYANHLANALERYCSSGTLKTSGTIMWY